MMNDEQKYLQALRIPKCEDVLEPMPSAYPENALGKAYRVTIDNSTRLALIAVLERITRDEIVERGATKYDYQHAMYFLNAIR